jgi:hypothetical protein
MLKASTKDRWIAALLHTAPLWALPWWLRTIIETPQDHWANAIVLLALPGVFMLGPGVLVPLIAYPLTSGFVRAQMLTALRIQGISALVALLLIAVAALLSINAAWLVAFAIAIGLIAFEAVVVVILLARACRGSIALTSPPPLPFPSHQQSS